MIKGTGSADCCRPLPSPCAANGHHPVRTDSPGFGESGRSRRSYRGVAHHPQLFAGMADNKSWGPGPKAFSERSRKAARARWSERGHAKHCGNDDRPAACTSPGAPATRMDDMGTTRRRPLVPHPSVD